ncbi:hypothetical protein CR513_01203, partial [Mucuna pruriens]
MCMICSKAKKNKASFYMKKCLPLGSFSCGPSHTREAYCLAWYQQDGLSVPVAFQYPEVAALFGLAPFGYFLSLGLKKYHSSSPNDALAARQNANKK